MLSVAASQLLLHACNQGDVEQCQSLVLEAKASLEYRNSLGETCLHIAATRGRISVTELLLALGADPNVATNADVGGVTPLHIAARKGCIRLTETLLQHHADANIADSLGMAPLHHAVLSGNTTLVELLVRHGASIQCVNTLGKTPRDIAEDRCMQTLIPLLSVQIPEGEAPPPPMTFKQRMELEDKRIVWKKTKSGAGR